METQPPDGCRARSVGGELTAEENIDLVGRRDLFLARSEQYLCAGLDRWGAARFVARAGGTLSGPALDVGTGKGLLAIELARLGLDVLSVDVDREEQALAALLAREAGVERRITFLSSDAGAIPTEDGSFGCAAMMDVLHHLHDPEPILSETVRLVRAGGVVTVADFSREGFEIVARVHRASGREHRESGVTVAAARAGLEGRGLHCRAELHAHWHEVLVMAKG